MKSKRHWQVLCFALLAAAPSVALADEGEQCFLHRELPVERQLRRLSIDLRGTVPDVAEYDAVAGLSELPDALLDEYLASDAFRVQIRRYHESLLWTNPAPALADVGFSLSTVAYDGSPVYYVPGQGKSALFRGGDGTHTCQNKSQEALGYDPVTGMPITEPMGTDAAGAWSAEGWVEVHPYWEADPAKKVKVCAFDAQTAATYTLPPGDPDAGTHSCDHLLATNKAKSCGCGPELSYCMPAGVVQPLVHAALREQMLRLIDEHTDGKQPYSGLLTTKRVHYNGPLAFYFKYHAQRQTFSRTQNEHQASDGPLPDLAFTDVDTWVAVEREAPHAGLLTLPAFLLRFQTNRGRANRYRIAFLGQYFQPPSTKDTNCAKESDDLTRRCVCRNCHLTLEPIAAYFGQFTEAGSMSLRDFAREYPTRKACAKGIAPQNAGWCDRHYVAIPDDTDPDLRPYTLKALQYADDEHPEIKPHFDAGPADLVKADIESGRFHEVATEHLFSYLMKREPNLDPTTSDYEGDALAKIAADFRVHDDIRQAVRDLVKLPAYRRMP
ncbi:hypothetical protein [Polyangium mundeleinium]|uniref:DUF1585 domain-containing protein n=1 Tax=Polyangium mundeleinium TaxID=2995306 RepID=A0ABT5EEM1_9BACT|nr:hypothetical protein [Polyangium mundeleinium]MDC0739929.1 hypothetical protein [Polyangium mundeleinium]